MVVDVTVASDVVLMSVPSLLPALLSSPLLGYSVRQDLRFKVDTDTRVAIVGPNGVGE